MESAVHHGAAAFVAGLQATGAEGNPAQARGAWRCGKRSAFPTSPHPRRLLRTNFKRGATLTIYLVQKIGQVKPTEHGASPRPNQYDVLMNDSPKSGVQTNNNLLRMCDAQQTIKIGM